MGSHIRWLRAGLIRGGGILALLVLPAWGWAADDLEKQLLKAAPTWRTQLQEAGYRNVGVLKFLVQKEGRPGSDQFGELNIRLAQKVELALTITNPFTDPLGIVLNASRTAATIAGASHLSVAGRQKLFEKSYPLAWGNESVIPDAFITGKAILSSDLQTLKIGLAVFDKQGKVNDNLWRGTIKPDLEDLLDAGQSFATRGAFDGGNVKKSAEEQKDLATKQAATSAVRVEKETSVVSKLTTSSEHPLSPQNLPAPVSLEVRYGPNPHALRPQPLEFRNGGAFIPEPGEGQQVVLVVRRKGSDRSRLGVVLKVNGENTLYRQKRPDAECAPWVFEPQLTEFGIQGFQLTDGRLEPFKVLSQAESKALEFDYGDQLGTISIAVFRERATPEVVKSSDDDDFSVLTRGLVLDKPARDLSALKGNLRIPGGTLALTRGVITGGAVIDSKIDTTKFTIDPVPIMAATVRYYQPQNLPK